MVFKAFAMPHASPKLKLDMTRESKSEIITQPVSVMAHDNCKFTPGPGAGSAVPTHTGRKSHEAIEGGQAGVRDARRKGAGTQSHVRGQAKGTCTC